MTMFAVGDVVVCVDAKPTPDAPSINAQDLSLIREGRSYRVRFVGEYRGEPCLRLEGVFTGFMALDPQWERSFRTRRFRKIQKADDQFIEQVKACRPRHRERIEARRAETGNTGSVHESRVSAGNLAHPPAIQEQS